MTVPASLSATVQKRVTAGGFLGFILIGALQAVFGPAIPRLREEFSLTAAGAGLALSAQFAGAVAGIVVTGLLERAGVATRWRLGGSTALLAVGCLGLGLAPSWPVALASALVAGLGFGGTDIGFNTVFSTGFGARSAAMLNLLNASFGIGAVLGPLAVSVSDGGFRGPFLASAALAATLVPLSLSAGEPARAEAAPARMPRGSWGLLGAFVALYFLYVGVETGVAGWEATHLASLGFSTTAAANLTALYWGALTLGRLVAAPISLRVEPQRIVLVSLALTAAFVALTHLPGLAPAGYTLTGFAMAPVFPTGLVWLGRVLPAGGITALVVAAASVGGVLFPPLVGAVRDAAGASAIPTALTGFAVASLAVALGLSGTLRRRAALVPQVKGEGLL